MNQRERIGHTWQEIGIPASIAGSCASPVPDPEDVELFWGAWQRVEVIGELVIRERSDPPVPGWRFAVTWWSPEDVMRNFETLDEARAWCQPHQA